MGTCVAMGMMLARVPMPVSLIARPLQLLRMVPIMMLVAVVMVVAIHCSNSTGTGTRTRTRTSRRSSCILGPSTTRTRTHDAVGICPAAAAQPLSYHLPHLSAFLVCRCREWGPPAPSLSTGAHTAWRCTQAILPYRSSPPLSLSTALHTPLACPLPPLPPRLFLKPLKSPQCPLPCPSPSPLLSSRVRIPRRGSIADRGQLAGGHGVPRQEEASPAGTVQKDQADGSSAI